MHIKRLITVGLLLLAAARIEAKTVGLWKDARSHITDGLLKTLQEAGWQTTILQGKDLSDETKLADLDVVFLPGGWNAYWFADFDARRALVKFTAGGKGILAGAFRGGYTRTANRPLFPEVGATYNRANGPFITGHGDSVLARAIDQPFCPGGWDHLIVKPGPQGKLFAVSGGDPVGVFGEVYGGRYLVFGAFIGIDAKTEPMQGTDRTVLLAMLDWLAGAPPLNAADKAAHETRADLDFLRREKRWDWTLHERGPDRGCGLIPTVRNRLVVPLESRLYTLRYLAGFIEGPSLTACRSATADLQQAMDELNRRAQATTEDAIARIERMTAAELLAATWTAEQVSAILMPEAPPKDLIDRTDRLLATLHPVVRKAKADRLARERETDRAALASLVEACAAADAATRRNAALELGRIGDPRAVPPLIALLRDNDETVRIHAILALGWMQANDAVPALIELADGNDLALRRRAIQALGQIGDPRAADRLVARIDDPDFFSAENAILALGWLKAQAAVPRLIALVEGLDPENRRQRSLALAAIRALGQIGDPSALPVLETQAATAGDFPMTRRGNQKIVNAYSTPQSLGRQGHAERAIAEIRAGGRKEPGIRQADFLSAQDKFYGLTRRFNALAGRISIVRDAYFANDPAALWPYLWEAGFTGVHQAWGEQDHDPEAYAAMVESAGDFDFLWIDVMPTGGNQFGGKSFGGRYGAHGLGKPEADIVLMKYADTPAFHGFWSEETYPDYSIDGATFETWLTRRYGAAFRDHLGLSADFDVAGRAWNTWSDKGTNDNVYAGPIKMAFLECAAEAIAESWKESQEWLSGLRKGCAFTYSISDAQPVKYPGLTARAGEIIAANGPETYQAFGRFNAFFMEMHKDGEARPAMSEFYNWYSPSPAHDARGFAQHLMHGECFYNFHLQHIFGLGTYDMWSWDATRWDHARAIFGKARAIRDYLAVPASAANVALVISDRSGLAFDPVNAYGGGLGRRWIQNHTAVWATLGQSQIPADVIWAESLTPEKLRRYRVLILSEAKILTDDTAAHLRAWVDAGGVLIATGTTSLFDLQGKLRADYQLAALLGVSYTGPAGITDPDASDTWQWRQGGPAAEKAIAGLEPERFRHYVHRHQKPSRSLAVYHVADDAREPWLPGLPAAAACEVDLPLGYDRVKPGSASVLARFDNGDPALTVNRVGNGLCYFWTPIYPALAHVASEWESQPNRHDFWPNVRELLEAMVRGGLTHLNATLPVDVTNVPKAIEVTVRQQPEHHRWMVHLLNYDVTLERVAAPALTIQPPAGRAVSRLYYPDTGTELAFATDAGGVVSATLRDFEIHEMLVIEWRK